MADLERDLLVTELRGLRRGRGATVMKVVACAVLMERLEQPDDPLTALRERIDAIGEDEHVTALLVAFGFERKERTLTERRTGYASKLWKHPDTLEAWENQMIEELATRLARTVTTVMSREVYVEQSMSGVLERVVAFQQTEVATVPGYQAQQDQLMAARDDIDPETDYVAWAEAERDYAVFLAYQQGRNDMLGKLSATVQEIIEELRGG